MTQILLDVDGVLADFSGAACRELSEVLGRECLPEQLTEWSFRDSFKLTEKEWNAFDKRVQKRGFCEGIEPIPGALAALDKLWNIGEILFVTSPWPVSRYWLNERIAWLDRFAMCAATDIIFTDRKNRVTGDVIIDDRPQNILHGIRKLRVLIPNSVNKRISKELVRDPDLLVTASWPRIISAVRDVR